MPKQSRRRYQAKSLKVRMTVARRRKLGEVVDYAGLRRVISARRRELGYSNGRALDEAIGWADGYASKLECGRKHFGDLSLPLLLIALRIKIVIFADPDPAPPAAPANVAHGRHLRAAPAQPATAKPAQVAPAPVPVVMRPKLDNSRQPRRTAPRLSPGATA